MLPWYSIPPNKQGFSMEISIVHNFKVFVPHSFVLAKNTEMK